MGAPPMEETPSSLHDVNLDDVNIADEDIVTDALTSTQLPLHYKTHNIDVLYINEKIPAEVDVAEISDDSMSMSLSDDDDLPEKLDSDNNKLAQASSSPGGGSDTSSTGGDDEEEVEEVVQVKLVRPAAHLPQPEAPPGVDREVKGELTKESSSYFTRSVSAPSGVPAVDVAAIGKFFRDRGNSFSAAIKRISSLKEEVADVADEKPKPATEFNISGLKVIVRTKESEIHGIKGRVSFFSRSGCRDCGAVRAFFREQSLTYVEINIDVFPERETELVDRTGSSSVPVIFFNEKMLGGLVALNSLRNSGEFERRLKEMAGRRCPESAPRVPVYGFDCEEGEWRRDEMVGMVRVVRQRLPIGDRILKMKIVRNCFSGSDMVEALIHQLDCGRKKAVEVGKELARKHFIHHVFRENDFEDGHNQFYRFLEHDPAIPKCFNFRGSTNDDEPKKAVEVGLRLTKLMSAILEAFATDDRRRLDYARISVSEEFRRYVNLVQDLQRVDIFALSPEEKTAFFLNLYNAMVIHAVIRIGRPLAIDMRAFFSDFQYIVGGYHYSLSTIKNGILRSNRRQPYTLIKPFSNGDRRLELALPKVNPLIHFGLCNGTKSSPTVRFFTAHGVDLELRYAAREFFISAGVEVDLERRNVHLTRIIKWYAADFGQDKDILKWLLNYLDATKAGLLTHLLNDGGPVSIVYQNFDWSLNS